MKKFLAVVLSAAMVLALAACGEQPAATTAAPTTAAQTEASTTAAPTEPTTAAPTEAPTTAAPTTEAVPEKKVMSYEEYMAAAVDTEVTVITCVQAKQSWWEKDGQGVGTFYTQDEDGAYFLYNMPCTKEEYDALVPGTRIKVTGFKSEWSGEVEIIDASYELMTGSYIAAAKDVTYFLAKDELINFQNQLVSLKAVTVEDYDGNGAAFAYKDAENKKDDLYFKVSKDGAVYELCVESYLCNEQSETYKAVEALKVDDVIDVEGFLYWYNGMNPHVTKVGPTAPEAKSEGVMTYEDYAAAELDSEVTIEAYVQAKQSWWEKDGQGRATIYTQDDCGAYFLYEMFMTREEFDLLVPGTKIKVTGFKSEWSGEVEIIDAKFEIEDGFFLALPKDMTDLLGKDELIEAQNQFVSFKGLMVEKYDESGAAFAYKDAENKKDDLYFKVSKDGKVYDLCVESYLCNEQSQVYKAVESLKVGQVIDVEGFLYWYNGMNPHITSVSVLLTSK